MIAIPWPTKTHPKSTAGELHTLRRILLCTLRSWSVSWISVGLVVATATVAPALASVHVLPTPGDSALIEQDALNASPQGARLDKTLQERTVEILRITAQRDQGTTRKPRTGHLSSTQSMDELAPADAAWLLGLLALHGLAMPADPAQAQHWFERAQMLSYPLAPAGLAWCQLSGCVGVPNPSAAMHWIALLNRIEPGLAKYLEWHAAKAQAPLTAPQLTSPEKYPGSAIPIEANSKLTRLLKQAARAGNAQASNELGLQYIASGNLEKALAQFQSASAKSEAAAANAILLTKRIQSDTNSRTSSANNRASDWYIKAQRYHRGDGVPANYTEAVRLYQVAASRGDPQARKMLELIFSRPLQDGGIDIAWMQQLASLNMGIDSPSIGVPPKGWQREPSPLYDLVPLQWRQTGKRFER